MSIRERAQLIFDELTEEQLEGFVLMFQNHTAYEPQNTAHSDEEIKAMLEEADRDVRNGKFYTKEEMDIFFKERFGI